MELTGNGLNKGSHMVFYTASQNAKKLLYYPVAAGEFYCNGDYNVKRENYNSILALYVLDGSITMEQGRTKLVAQRDELLLIDCYTAHRYFADSYAHTLWVHFDGNNAGQWFQEIKAKKGQKIKCTRQAAESISNIIQHITHNQTEYSISKELYSMLCTISSENAINRERRKAGEMEAAKQLIVSRYQENLSIGEMAKVANMSVSYFSKIFKAATGFSPYEYLLTIRLEKAKEFLRQTDDSIDGIAYNTGFNSTSNFIYFFKKETGISPLKFRKLQF